MIYETKNIRNVVLLGHSGSGKTTFSETMLFEAGASNGEVQLRKGVLSPITRTSNKNEGTLFSVPSCT
ncbi:MAG: ATP-binding cassette domain-containing protein [Bacteroidota bacterium]